MRRGRKSGRYRRGVSRTDPSPGNIATRSVSDSDYRQNEGNPVFVSGDEASCDFEGFAASSFPLDDGVKSEQSSSSEVVWGAFPESIDAELAKNESLNLITDSFDTSHQPSSFEAEVKIPLDADQKSWEAVFGDHNQMTAIASSFLPSNAYQLATTTSKLKPSPQSFGRISVSLNRLEDDGNTCTTNNLDSSNIPFPSTDSKIGEAVKQRARGRGRARGKTKRPPKTCKREIIDDNDQPVSPAPVTVSLPDLRPASSSPILPPAKRHKYALKFREKPDPFVMDPGYVRDLKYLESLRPKNIKEEHDLLIKLNMVYDHIGTDNFPHLLRDLRRKLIVRKEQRENGLPVFDLDSIEKFLDANGRVPTTAERLRMDFVKTAASGGAS